MPVIMDTVARRARKDASWNFDSHVGLVISQMSRMIGCGVSLAHHNKPVSASNASTIVLTMLERSWLAPRASESVWMRRAVKAAGRTGLSKLELGGPMICCVHGCNRSKPEEQEGGNDGGWKTSLEPKLLRTYFTFIVPGTDMTELPNELGLTAVGRIENPDQIKLS